MTGGPALLYLDTSALARLYTAEPGHERVRAEVEATPDLAAHLITYVEMRATLASRLARNLLRPREHGLALDAFETDWETFTHITVNEDLIQLAGDLAARYGLRAYDAVHLASARTLQPLGVKFMTFDQALARAAELELPGLVVRAN